MEKNTIVNKNIIASLGDVRIVKMRIFSPEIADTVKPGQFIVLMVNEKGERLPFTVVKAESELVTIIFQEIGYSTKLLGRLDEGGRLFALVGPLGHASKIKNYGRVMLVAGGVGIAEILPIASKMKEEGNHVCIVIGSKTKSLIILEDELRNVSDEIYIVTDDGSYGEKGFTTNIMKEKINSNRYDLVYTVGPILMMQKAAEITKEKGIKTVACLNSLILDGTGMCGCCRVTIGGEVRFACVDGPEFDAHLVDWKELMSRTGVYKPKEEHICKLYKK
ncbi:MAG: sulfide/dihydroorotate dehydrogenase-like FAD/NAD-binding protein [Elusimicrobiota bacterium]